MNANQKLLNRIDECVSQPCEIYSDHEKALYVLADCREALTKEYAPMTDLEIRLFCHFNNYEGDIQLIKNLEALFIKRANLIQKTEIEK